MAKTLLSSNNKLSKPVGDDAWLIRGLALAPNILSGTNVCPWATPGCINACVLWFAGRTNSASVRARMIERTQFYFADRPAFRAQLRKELEKLVRDADKLGARAACRLNVASDILWEIREPWIFDGFPSVQFYDYTKAPASKRVALPANYSLTHSVSEKTTLQDVKDACAAGRNLCVVFDADYRPSIGQFGELPATVRFNGRSLYSLACVDGDRHDLRIRQYDGAPVVVALRGKGGAARVAQAEGSGFVRHVPEYLRTTHDVKRVGGYSIDVQLN